MTDLTYKFEDTLSGEQYVHFFGGLIIQDVQAKFIDNEGFNVDRQIQVKVFSKKQSITNMCIDAVFNGSNDDYKSVWRTHSVDDKKDILLSTVTSIVSKNRFENTDDRELAYNLECDMFVFELEEIQVCALSRM